ncbi:tetratricopeptide repeat protein [Roseivirga sp. BDSF3-8]|uniref:tetratricopeptide repeat protein n=1 Tax=Roseivirga sp. BDSF3-8 TaxID=3241598 RepID=UPI003531C4E3
MSKRISIFICFILLASLSARTQTLRVYTATGTLADTLRINENLTQARAVIRSQPQQATALISEALSLSEGINHYPSQIRVRILQGTNSLYKGEYEAALGYFRQGIQLAELLDDELSQGRIYNNMAVIYRKQGHYPNALKLYMKALGSFEALKDDFRTAHVLTNIANVYSDNDLYEEAIAYHKRALAIMERLGKQMEAGAILNNLGNCYYETDNPQKALKAYREAFAIRQEMGDGRGTAITLHNIGNIQCDEKAYSSCLESYREALRLAVAVEDAFGISTYSASLGNAYLMTEHMDSAQWYLGQALEMSQHIGAKSTELETLQMMARLDSALGNYKRAFVNYQQYAALKDSLFNLQNAQQITRLQSEYEVKARQQENLALKSEVVLWKKLALFLYLGIIVVFALFLAYRAWLKNRKKQQVKAGGDKQESAEMAGTEGVEQEKESELLRKKQELSTLHLQMMQQNKTLGALRSRLQKEEASDVAVARGPALKEVARELDKLIKGDDNWQSFQVHFESIHTGFFKRLQDKFPGLTLNDHKLCAYLRLNLSTKEIAKLLHVSPAAIQKSRQRLRKKMNLQAESDLSLILSNI